MSDEVPLAPRPSPLIRAKTRQLQLPKSKPVDVVFQDVRFKVSEGPIFNKRTKQVLKGVSGRFLSGELTAIMGPSGAGKSSLLNILSGFHREGMKGTISSATRASAKGGKPVLVPLSRKDCCYIMQDDNLTPLLSVAEVMRIAADLKLSQDHSPKAKAQLIEDILSNVGLSPSMDTKCGRLSGGQRKRLSVALELINNPPVMFLDEPTTGLDSSSTMQIVTLLKELARGGRTIICTMHQPSASIFETFDHMYIIGAGRCVYQGAATNVVPFLQSVGLPCPQYHNPADFVLDVVSGEFGDHTQQLVDTATNSLWRKPSPPVTSRNSDEALDLNHQTPPSEWFRFRVLLKRTIKLMFRDWTVIYLKFFMHCVVGLLIGALYQQSGVDGNKSINNLGYFLCSAVYLSYTSLMPAILKFPSELNVIKKEQFNNWYKLRTYYIAFQITNIPIQMIFCAQYIAISYYLTSQILERDRFLMFLLVNMITIVISECLGLGLGTSINPVNGIFFGAVSICFMILMAGFLALLKDMPRIMYYMAYCSYLRYTMEGMVLAMYSFGRQNLRCDEIYCHYRIPGNVLDELDMRFGNYWRDVSMLVLMAVSSFLYAYFSLRSKMR